MADWARLAVFLRAAAEDAVRLTWAELDDLVDGVPKTATTNRAWWSGDRSHVRMWRDAGFVTSELSLGQEVTFIRTGIASDAAIPAGNSGVQRDAEAAMLKLLWADLGMEVRPERLVSPSGALIDVDGVSSDRSILVECFAHQGPAKGAQKYKLVNDATKLHWAASWLSPKPKRLLLCVSDEAAVKHLRGRSWQGQAIKDLGIEIVVVGLPTDVSTTIRDAQERQFR